MFQRTQVILSQQHKRGFEREKGQFFLKPLYSLFT